MKHIVQLTVSRDDGQYVAEGVNLPVVTQGETLDELMDNIQEVVSLVLEDEDPRQYGLEGEPSVLINYELTDTAHAS
ncbi:MAG: type II toxin-antitoxin system HicB family antitoxin [Candidatus Paceibacterota bacterium]